MSIAPLCACLIWPALREKDKEYSRSTREAAFGRMFEAIAAESDETLASLTRPLAPLRSTIACQPFVAGVAPIYADHAVFGAFQWARIISSIEL